ncbi:MAG: IS1 family transposase [Saprospiraceae bacterium]|nr:IS1 family transposase [Saprospiraceae bacterium]
MDKKKAQSLPDIVTTLLPAKKKDVLELDELWSFVGSVILGVIWYFCVKLYEMVLDVKCCHKCGSEHIVKNGSNASGNPKYKCKACGFGGVFQTLRKSEEFKEMVVRAAQERSSSRGLARTFGISHQTALRWIKKKRSPFPTS